MFFLIIRVRALIVCSALKRGGGLIVVTSPDVRQRPAGGRSTKTGPSELIIRTWAAWRG
jgi:hypothetical protein